MYAAEVFEEWDAYATRRRFKPREVDLDAVIAASENKIVSITGIRRSGKSSLLMLLRRRLEEMGERAAYLNLEDTRLTGRSSPLDDALKWFGDEGTLLLDEVTAAPDHEGWLARTHEFLKGNLRLVVTSSRRTHAAPSKPLRGRVLPVELYPLSLREHLAFKDIHVEPTTSGRGRLEKALLEHLQFGGFPEVALMADETGKVAILGSYLRDIVGLDVAEASAIPLPTVKAFTDYALQAPTFSASKALTYLKTLGHRLGKDTVLTLEHYTESSYLVHYTHIYSHNIKNRAQYPRKAYPGDTGFNYALQGRVDLGRLYENAALLELKRRSRGVTEINYWKNGRGAETDLIVRQGNTVKEAIQVTYDLTEPKTYRRETEALAKCATDLHAEKAIILTGGKPNQVRVNGVDIEITPLLDWLLGTNPPRRP